MAFGLAIGLAMAWVGLCLLGQVSPQLHEDWAWLFLLLVSASVSLGLFVHYVQLGLHLGLVACSGVQLGLCLPSVYSVQLGLWHLPAGVGFLDLGTPVVRASRLGPPLACSLVQLGLHLSAAYLILWMLLSGH